MEQRWTERKRRDGLAIVEGIDGRLIMPSGERLPVDKCPCCEQGFGTDRAARVAADMLYPMQETGDANG